MAFHIIIQWRHSFHVVLAISTESFKISLVLWSTQQTREVGRERPQSLSGSIISTMFHCWELAVWPYLDAVVSGKFNLIVFTGGCNRLGESISVKKKYIVLGCIKKSRQWSVFLYPSPCLYTWNALIFYFKQMFRVIKTPKTHGCHFLVKALEQMKIAKDYLLNWCVTKLMKLL